MTPDGFAILNLRFWLRRMPKRQKRFLRLWGHYSILMAGIKNVIAYPPRVTGERHIGAHQTGQFSISKPSPLATSLISFPARDFTL